MAKIISIKDGVVLLGNSDNSLSEIRTEDCNFNPSVGDEVEVYENEEKLICIKKETKEAQNSGVNINLVQNQGSNNIGESPRYAHGKRAVNKVTYIILALLLGGLGAHKFYAGKPGLGVIYLLFFWTYIPAIIALIEIIVALCQPADNNGRILV